MRLACVTCYFNPAGFRALADNYRIFADRIKVQGVDLYTIEHSLKPDAWTLPNNKYLIRAYGGDPMWQKERLLQHAITQLPDHYDAVAWVDCDVLFVENNWWRLALKKLEDYGIMQLFDHLYYLPRGHTSFRGTWVQQATSTFKQVHQLGEEEWYARFAQGTFSGTPGLAWAARRDFFDRVGMADRHIIGAGDHYMACAMLEVQTDRPIPPRLRDYVNAYQLRMNEFHPAVTFLPQNALHLWHGTASHRNYRTRDHILVRHDYDPYVDVIEKNGVLCWNSDKPIFHDEVQQYFNGRHEDG